MAGVVIQRRRLGRFVRAGLGSVLGLALVSPGCTIDIPLPWVNVSVGPGGVEVVFPGGSVDVSEGGVDVEFPGGSVVVGDP